MISVEAPWDSAETILVMPQRETAHIPTKNGKSIDVEVLVFVKAVRVGGQLMDLDGAKALVSALMSRITYLENIP